jgi:hypothetical protein
VAAATSVLSLGVSRAKNSFIALWLASRMPRPSICTNWSGVRSLKPVADSVECAGDAALHKAAGLGKSNAHNPVDLALPLALGMLGQDGCRLVAHFEVVDAEVSGVGMGHVDGDQGNLGLLEDVATRGATASSTWNSSTRSTRLATNSSAFCTATSGS